MKKLVLLTSKDCHLCVQALTLLNQLDLKDFDFIEEDIYSKRSYLDNYWDKIPVLLKDGNELTWPFDEKLLVDFLN